jgi:serine protein kinase
VRCAIQSAECSIGYLPALIHERMQGLRRLRSSLRVQPRGKPDEERVFMYNDSLFNAFARTFEARSESGMSMAEYLDSCRGDPMRYANASERLLAAICQPQVIDTARDPRLGRIFLNRTLRVYPAFAAGFFGMKDTIERIVGFLRRSPGPRRAQADTLSAGAGGRQKIFAGRAVKSLMEVNPIYALKAGEEHSSVFEVPLSLFYRDRRGRMPRLSRVWR